MTPGSGRGAWGLGGGVAGAARSRRVGDVARVAIPALLVALVPAALSGQATPLGSAPGAPPGTTPVLRDVATATSAARVRSDLERLVGFGTRHTLSDTVSATRGIGAARRWVHAQFDSISSACGGCLEVRYLRSTVGPSQRIPQPIEVVDVIAVQRGTTDPERRVMISGHLDSRASDVMDPVSDAPGAVDDASGVSAVLEAARVLSAHRFAATIVYVAVSGEEQGLFGSTALAEEAKRSGWRVEAFLNNDVVGNTRGQNGASDNTLVRVFSEGTRADETPAMARTRRYTGGEDDSPSRNLARYVHRIAHDYAPNLDVMMVYRLDRFGRGGDHRPFTEAGFPAVRLTEPYEDYRRQHQDVRTEDGVDYGDVLEAADPAYTAKVAGLDAAALASMAWAPPPPSGVEVEGAVEPSTTLRWKPVDRRTNPKLAGYRVYWRLTTSPVWQWSAWAGDTTAITLENVVVDNYFFGVASVSADGFESPVVFPGPVGAFEPAAP